ncbi:tRNA (N6-isopentenyl adenosine(37)-C2)-methylthiotransferase MiaB [Candidatus Aerophobetes bacterium]|uniref:tRNA-2-methylthio-N(6)-dimethylallyladenosine synthase n=1 Tax=Aerophobetes bacterium TaxID=2030807 RepID=A0A2A4WYU8_UNCAE|nr:MAG: tRNA (N6-isopentenyl adenosine(37)-C2)-methylthiotransferase MiaB [Candidatus Aerophobetes bacterium]
MKRSRPVKKFFIKTYGCQMNELDSEIMVGQLEKKGLTRTLDEKDADLLLFNTCSIRDLAERKVMGKVGTLMRMKHNKPIIGITGCMAMAKKESLLKKLPNIDFVLGTNNISDLSNVLDHVIETGQKTVKTDDAFEENLDYLCAKRDDKIKAHVSIIRGCDKYCTYCVVPYTRGKEVSRSSESIVSEVQMLADKGYKEVTLLGQNVNSYGKDTPENKTLFHDLLYKLDKIEGIDRIRFLTSHPIDITKELMHAIADLPSLCKFVHFPIQAGSSRILRKMHRIYTKEQYFEKVAMLQSIVPGVAIGTDIIVGFPTETEAEFQETYDAFKTIGFSQAFLYTYSPRKGTPAIRWKDDITESVKQDRLHRLMDLYDSVLKVHLEAMLGTCEKVLIEGTTRSGFLKGRTSCWKKAIVQGPSSLIGSIVDVDIHSFNHQTLIGKLAQPAIAFA